MYFFGIKTVSWQCSVMVSCHVSWQFSIRSKSIILVNFLYEIYYETTSDYIFTMVRMIPCASACAQGMEGAREGDEHVYYQGDVGLQGNLRASGLVLIPVGLPGCDGLLSHSGTLCDQCLPAWRITGQRILPAQGSCSV